MSVGTAAGSRFFLGPANDTADEIGDYEALAYVEVGEIEDMGEFGDQANIVQFTAIGNRRVRKFKGSYDAGDMNMTLGFDAGDAGQTALVAALASDSDFAVRITLPDGDDTTSPAGDPTTFYFRAKITSNRRNVGNAENIVRRMVMVAINSEIIEVAAS